MNNSRFTIDPRLKESIELLSKTNDIHNRFQELLKMDFSSKDSKDIYNTIRKQLIYLPLFITYTRPYNIDRFSIYRVRTDVNESVENINLTRTFTYPNSCFCTSNGRANLKYNPVFYCTDIPGTALAEIKPAADRIVFLSRWNISCHRSCVYTSFLPFDIPVTNSFINIARNRYKETVDFFFKNYGDDLTEKIKIILNSLASIYCYEKAPYFLSSSLSNHYLYEKGVDYILYPSTQTTFNSCNIALNPNFADEFLKLDMIFKLRLVNTFEMGATVEVMEVGEYYSSYIIWRSPTEEDINFMSKLPSDNNIKDNEDNEI